MLSTTYIYMEQESPLLKLNHIEEEITMYVNKYNSLNKTFLENTKQNKNDLAKKNLEEMNSVNNILNENISLSNNLLRQISNNDTKNNELISQKKSNILKLSDDLLHKHKSVIKKYNELETLQKESTDAHKQYKSYYIENIILILSSIVLIIFITYTYLNDEVNFAENIILILILSIVIYYMLSYFSISIKYYVK